MAHIRVGYVSKVRVMGLMNKRYLCHIHFKHEQDYNKAVSLGFNKDVWEAKNNNKVIIENGVTCYNCNSELSECEYGKCEKCINTEQEWRDNYTKQYIIDNPPTFWDKIRKFLR